MKITKCMNNLLHKIVLCCCVYVLQSLHKRVIFDDRDAVLCSSGMRLYIHIDIYAPSQEMEAGENIV